MTTYIQFHSPSTSLSPENNTVNTPTESSSSSDGSTTASAASFSDEEVKLASRNPKKRAGRKKFRETRHPVYRGVRRRDSGNWVCEVREPNKKTRVWLGTYPTADMAARAHDVAALAMRGRSACLNFADSVWRLPVPKSGSVKDIQEAAVMAAEGFRRMGEGNGESPRNVVYVDEEVVFEMPRFLADMAEGLMVPPPRMVGYDTCLDDLEYLADVSLWNF